LVPSPTALPNTPLPSLLPAADSGNHRIRAVNLTGTPTNTISTVAGSGGQSFSGDGGAATDATLNVPGGVALFDNSELIIAGDFPSFANMQIPQHTPL
jgi:hypothetical protein